MATKKDEIEDTILDELDAVSDSIKSMGTKAKNTALKGKKEVTGSIKSHPLAAVGLACAVGVVVGMLLRK